MSYSRNYHETVTVSGSQSRTVSYPKSETGGSVTVTINYTEHVPVDVTINVDTNPFDTSIDNANDNISLLTGSVVTSEAAHVAAKIKNSEKISESITSGFYGLIKSEISQQLAEMMPRIDALIVEMAQYQQSCLLKKEQLESDFRRITERHVKLFQDLDRELHRRVHMLNQSAITTLDTLTACARRPLAGLGAGISTIFSREGSNLQSILLATGLKKKALSLIRSAKSYLESERNLSAQLNTILDNTEIDSAVTRYVPVLYLEANLSEDAKDVRIVLPDHIPDLDNRTGEIKDSFLSAPAGWEKMDEKTRDRIDRFFTLHVADENQKIAPRVAEQMMKLLQQDTEIQTNAFNYSA